MSVELADKWRVKTSQGVESGPLVSDETGVAVIAGRKWMSPSHPGTYYLIKWADVTGYEISGNEQGGGAAAALNHDLEHARCTLVLKTATDQKAFALKCGPARVRNLIGNRLAAVDARARA